MTEKVKAVVGRIRVKAADAEANESSKACVAKKENTDAIEITRLNVQIFDLGAEINTAYRKLGELMYAAYTGDENGDDTIETLLAEIDVKKSEIASIRAHITELKKTVLCPTCGAECLKNDSFCRHCGNKIGE